ncbi:cytochrome P450 [Hypoxylon sp. NC0597]|nr:cytochrome P450 [Hypoxylon sp. NC0597]
MLKAIIVAFILGVLTHQGLFIRREWHLQAPIILGAYLLITPLFLLLITTHSQQLSMIEIIIPVMVYFVSLLVSIGVYRLYFHRLRGFPGPRLVALSKLWHVWKCRDSRNHHVLESWHRKYGTFVRTGPNEITIFHPAAFEIMDGPKNRNIRSDCPAIWIPRITFAFFPRVWKLRHWFKMLSFGDSCMSSRIEDYKSRSADNISNQLLSGDTATLVVAGRSELEGIDISDFQRLSGLQHLTATIYESMRLLPASLTSSSRVTPAEGLTIEGTFIPRNTKIAAARYSIGRLVSAYENPDEFIPERWYSKPKLVEDKRAFAPFGIGRNGCAGKSLAMHQLRFVIATLLSNYNIKFAPNDENGEAVERDMKDQLTATPGKLILVFEKRNGS